MCYFFRASVHIRILVLLENYSSENLFWWKFAHVDFYALIARLVAIFIFVCVVLLRYGTYTWYVFSVICENKCLFLNAHGNDNKSIKCVSALFAKVTFCGISSFAFVSFKIHKIAGREIPKKSLALRTTPIFMTWLWLNIVWGGYFICSQLDFEYEPRHSAHILWNLGNANLPSIQRLSWRKNRFIWSMTCSTPWVAV